MSIDFTQRRDFAEALALEAGAKGLSFQRELRSLEIETKGPQDFVTEADRALERQIRAGIIACYPDDAILGEEYGATPGRSGHTWVIDPIDGTSNFIADLPLWCVSIACFYEGRPVAGAIHAPVVNDLYSAARGHGTMVNRRAAQARQDEGVGNGTVGLGFPGGLSGQDRAKAALAFADSLIDAGGVFVRPGSGAIMLADVAAGRFIGAVEVHMNSWDCLAALLMIEEAGGRIAAFDGATILEKGARIIAAGPHVFDQINAMAEAAFGAFGFTETSL